MVKYLGEGSAEEVLPGGGHALLASSVPLRSSVGSGVLAPVSLGLEERGGVYQPVNPLVPVSIAASAAGGVSLPLEVSVAPVQAAGGEPARVVGDQVVYPGTAPDTDFMAEPVPFGVEVSWQLLSQSSPQDNALRFSLPAGASLRMSATAQGAVEVVREGEALYVLPPARAVEADGVGLPVSYSVSENIVSTHVDLGGSVDFPVLVDPLVEGKWGYLGGEQWDGWGEDQGGPCGCYEHYQYPTALGVQTKAGASGSGSYGQWYIDAPGAGSEGGSSITRVDLNGVWHGVGETYFVSEIYGTNGSDPVWTFNGTEGAMGKSPYYSATDLTQGHDMTFCAQGAGGHDGGEQPLCNENDGGESYTFWDVLSEPTKYENWSQIGGASVQFLDTTAPNEVKLRRSLPEGQWIKGGENLGDYVSGHDQGVGMKAFSVEIPPGHLSESGQPVFAYETSCPTDGFDGCPQEASSTSITWPAMETGVYTLGVYGWDAAGNVREEQPDPKMYVDRTPPKITLSGALNEHSGGEVGEGAYAVSFSAEDGSTEHPQSGVKLFNIMVDGRLVDTVETKCAKPSGIPSAGCFGLSGSWTFEGQRFGVGAHTVEVDAWDWAGNEATSLIQVTVNGASYQPDGPGAVNLTTGDYKLSSTDVAVAGAGGDLSLSRTYDSRQMTQGGVGGPLGPQWSLSLPDVQANGQWQSLRAMPNGSVQVTAASGGSLVFTASGSSYTAPAGFQTLVLTKGSSSEFRLTNAAGDVSIFTRANSEKEEAPLFVPTGVEQAAGAGGLNKMTYLYATSEGVTRPVGVVAPEPSGAGWSCASRLEKHEELVNGCRALELVYATETKAGGKESEWGEYKGRLSEVMFIAYSPSSKKVARTPVARYLYDKQGRLRAEWNPEIPGPLKTIYGYDSEGHVTAVTGPSLEPWVITYGTASGDASTGRVLRVTQAPESGKLGWREQPQYSEAPKLSGSPVVGVTLGASSGTWSNEPVAYGYQWEDCNSTGQCTAILGASNPNYTVASSDVGYRLEVVVTATDSGGSAVASSAQSEFVTAKAGTYVQGIDSGHSFNAVSCIPSTTDCVLSDSAGKALYTTNASSSVPATWSSWSGPSGQSPSQAVDCPTSSLCLLADGKETSGGKLYYATTLGGAWSEAYNPSTGVDAISCASSALCVSTQDGLGYFRYATSPASTHWETEAQGTAAMRSVFCLPAPSTFCAIADGSGQVQIATSTSQIESSSWKETDIDGSSALNGVACTSSSSCVAVDGAGNVLDLAVESSGAATASKHDIDGSTSLTAVTCTGESTCVTVDKAGNVFVSKNSGETWTEQYSFGGDLTSVSCSSTSLCVAGSTTGEAMMFNPAGGEKSEGTHYNPGPGSTIEYHVPLSGTGLPNMTKAEVEKWAQKEDDDPLEGTAIFPPSKPVGWPANKYEQATIFYIDSSNKTVNTLSAAGGISTAEYDTRGNVTRTLTADDRAKALKESNPAEAAEHLSTINTYNEGSEPGTELQSTLGPEHKIKLKNGNEVQARKHVVYSYEEGAPSEGGPYRLVTKTTEAALVAGKEEDERTVEKAYSGRAGLGWKLHKPTSTTEAPGGLNLTHATAYSTTTGDEIETEMPGADGEGGTSYAFSSEFGSSGTGNGQFNHPGGIAVAPNSDLWVIDQTNDRIEEFTNEGEYLRQAGSKGTGNGQLEDPSAIAVDTHGNVWVADTINYRVEEFNEKGEFIKTFGAHGEEAGKFRFPQGIAIDEHGDVWVSDSLNDRIEEFNEKGEYIKTIAEGKGEPDGLEAVDGDIWVADWSQDRIQEYTESGTLVQQFGSEGTGNGQLQHPYDVASEAKGNILVADNGNDRVDEFNEKGEYQGQFGAKGLGHFEFTAPIGLAIDSHGKWVTNPKADTVEKWLPPDPTTGNKGAYDSEITYYSPKTEAGVAACENHPEWANLPCQTKPYRQPEVTGLPEIPVTTYTYNMWDEPEITKTTSGSATRTETDTYEPSGRIASREITATTGETFPKVSYKYSTSTGALIKQSTGSGETEKKIESTFNDFGELTAYTDAAGTTSTYKYDIDGRPTETNDGKGTQHYEYSETTGLLAKLTDSSNEAMKFTTTYDPEGNLTEETYPNGMTATTTYNPVGEATSLEYTKTTNCTEEEKEKCKWFKDTIVPSIHGQWMSQTSTLSKETYNYDETGRLTETHETPAGKHCKTRVYRYDEDGNRLSLTKSESSTETCNGENTTEENHAYDTADQLADTGVEYNPFGDTTKLPSTDADGEPLTSRYYTDGQLSEQEQHHETIGYKLDPARRTLETVSTGEAASDVTNHYSSEGNSPSWSAEPGEKWARYIQGPTGLTAIQTNGETPVLQIANLHGDIIGTASMSTTATKLLSTTDTTEYGVPTSGAPPRYSWLGTKELPTELPSGITAIGARSYAPQLGRFLQPDPTPGGSADAYAYTYGNPLNETDPTGQWTLNQTSSGASAIGGTGEGTTLTGGTGIAANAIMPPPVNTEIEAAFQANPPWDQATAGTEEYEEYWEEEWEEGGYEEAAYHPGAKPAGEEPHLEEGLLVQPLEAGAGEVEGKPGAGGVVRLCSAEPKEASVPCAQYASIFGKAWHWVTHHIHKLVAAGVGAIGTVVALGATALATTGCAASAAITADPFEAFDCYKIGIFGTTLTFAVAASTFKAWNDTKN